jgi:hypothetical protein
VTPAAVNKYQRRRAVAGPWALSGNHGRSFDGVVVIPALAEEQSLPETLNSLGSNPARWREKILVVVVVNNRCDAPQPWREQNGRTLTLLEEAGGSGFGLNLAWVDASSAGLELPGDEGVGLARKIGFDLALECLDWRGDPLCASLDADTLTDGNYFKALMAHFRNCTSAGAVVPFRHCRGATPELDDAITHYELYLRHYVLGLELARSPYAYHTIGSALACRAEAYVAAGGMNRRKAGEDFYFLQQLAKIGGIEQVGGTMVYPAARLSARTPFGTGPALARLQDGELEAVRFSTRESFQLLGAFLRAVERAVEEDVDEITARLAPLSPALADFLGECGLDGFWSKLYRQHRRPDARRRAFHQWFDALRTRRMISRICDHHGWWGTAETVIPSLLTHLGLPSSGNADNYLKVLRKYQKSEAGV